MTTRARGAAELRALPTRRDHQRARRRARRQVVSAAALVAISAGLLVWSAAGRDDAVSSASSASAVLERSADPTAEVRQVSDDRWSAGALAVTGSSTGSTTRPTGARSNGSTSGSGAASSTGTRSASPSTSDLDAVRPPPTPGSTSSSARSADGGASSTAPAAEPGTVSATGSGTAPVSSARQSAQPASPPRAAVVPVSPATASSAASPAVPSRASAASSSGEPLAGAAFWVDPDSSAARELARGGDSALSAIAAAPSAVWLGDWVPTAQVGGRVASVVQRAGGAVPVLVLYAVPGRDCGSYSAGGLGGPEAYAAWVRAVAAGIGDRRVVVVLEPDALAQVDCLSGAARAQRSALLRDAVGVLAATGAVTYLDAGNSGWVDAGTMAQRLRDAGVAQARGFALNTSNFQRTADEEAYGERLSAALGGSHYVVDTSRNGNGPATGNLSWCNPRGRALGELPTTATRAAHADAYLWVKRVGESDGECGREEPPAGTWWPQYAVGLARGAS